LRAVNVTACTVGAVAINVVDAEREQRFWSELLDVGLAREVHGFFVPGATPRRRHRGALERVAEAKTNRKRVHLDTGVDDLDAAQVRIEELGEVEQRLARLRHELGPVAEE